MVSVLLFFKNILGLNISISYVSGIKYFFKFKVPAERDSIWFLFSVFLLSKVSADCLRWVSGFFIWSSGNTCRDGEWTAIASLMDGAVLNENSSFSFVEFCAVCIRD